MAQPFTADAIFGPTPGLRPQPNDVPVATHPAGTAEPMARTERRPAQAGPLANPIVVLVVLLGVAVLLLQVSVRGEVSVRG